MTLCLGAQPIDIFPIVLPETDVVALASDARCESYRFVDRLIREWADGTNRFNRDGECFLGAWEGDALVGIGGLNRAPYVSAGGVARLRHLYVTPARRCRGIGSILIGTLIERASAASFASLHLRTDNTAAARLYERRGFSASAAEHSTHSLQLPSKRLPARQERTCSLRLHAACLKVLRK